VNRFDWRAGHSRAPLLVPFCFAVVLWCATVCNHIAFAADTVSDRLHEDFNSSVLPFLKNYCLDCHGVEKQEGKLSLNGDSNVAAVIKNYKTWEILAERLTADEMPPKDAPKQPTLETRRQVLNWIEALRKSEAQRNAGDPGTVLARRLSNAEFDYTIRDLTSIDIKPTREFPVDPANEAGFDNSGESLTISPALVKKYLAAARQVADHAVLTQTGIEFAPHPAVTDTDRDKYFVHQIVNFYEQHDVDLADYFYASWQFYHRHTLGLRDATLKDIANLSTASPRRTPSLIPEGSTRPHPNATRQLSPRYLEIVWSALNAPEAIGPMAELQAEWSKLISSDQLVQSMIHKQPDELAATTAVRRQCDALRELAIKLRKSLDNKVDKLHVKGNSDGSQPLILWWNRQIASQRMKFVGDGKQPELDAARDRFCHVFPNAFSISSRGHYADPNLGAQVRLLTAGFHLMQGYFRDDQPLYELVLSDADRNRLDMLWKDLNFVTLVPLRQYKDFLFFERAESPRFAGGPEFDFARPEDKDVIAEVKIKRLCEAYLANARKYEDSQQAMDAIQTYFDTMSSDFRWIEKMHLAAESHHLQSLQEFARRAYRRPLSAAERDELLTFYQSLRQQDGLNHEDAVRDCLASILLSPHFCFRFDLASPGEAVRPLSDYEIASRLSYFLWSSMPDDELISQAEKGNLHQPDVLRSQVGRMLRDPRIRGLATEFVGNWLEFRRFEEHNSVDRERFSTFTNELRQAMYEEPIRLFVDICHNNRSVLGLIDGDYTFVNKVLAAHYCIDFAKHEEQSNGGQSEWIRVDHAGQYGRGGLLGMSVFLTKNSPGLRTSPVKRGYWVVRRLLGEHIPAPPPEVPELPKDEANLGELTLPQLLARHRDHKACAGCHRRFDSIGLVFEGYGPIGEQRQNDLGGKPVNSLATFPDGKDRRGLDGLRQYLLEQRRSEFVENFDRKLLSYALGRGLLMSDQATLDQMRASSTSSEHRFESVIDAIITSPQFLTKRGRDDTRH